MLELYSCLLGDTSQYHVLVGEWKCTWSRVLISLVTPSLGGVFQRNLYHGVILTSGYIHSVQGGHFWSLLAPENMPVLSLPPAYV